MNRTILSPTWPMADATLAAAVEHCRQVTRQRARNFYYGLKLLPQPKRSALYVVYAFMRACDDLADSAPAVQETLTAIESFRSRMHTVFQGQSPADHDPMWQAFTWLIQHYPIEVAHLNDMLDGQRMDLTQTRYANFQDLYGYCYRVASTVGLVCLSVWGAGDNPQAAQLAEKRGIALQLTNILRDLVEDAGRDRLYLPAEDLARFGLEPQAFIEQLKRGQADRAFISMMQFQIERARSYYEQSAGLEAMLQPQCRPTCWAMMRIYECLLEKIAADPASVLHRRVRLSSFHKLGIALRASYQRSLGR